MEHTLEAKREEAIKLQNETEEADKRALPPRLNLELLEANGEMHGEITSLKEENERHQP